MDFVSLHDDIWRDFFFPTAKENYPKTNAYLLKGANKLAKSLVIEMVVPFCNRESIHLDIDEHSRMIVVEGTPVREQYCNDNIYALREIPRSFFRRSFRIAGQFDLSEEKVSAELTDGVLRIEMPVKRSEVKTRRINLK